MARVPRRVVIRRVWQVRESEQARAFEKQHLMAMMKSGRRVEQLPYYVHAAMVLMGDRNDAPPIPNPSYAPRYSPQASQALLEAEAAGDLCDKMLQCVPAIVARFNDFRLTKDRSEALIDEHGRTVAKHQETLSALREEELEARTQFIASNDQRSMNVEFDEQTAELERAKVHERRAQTKMRKRGAILASMSESLISIALDTSRVVSLEEDANIVLLASKLRHASLLARPRLSDAGLRGNQAMSEHPVLELMNSLATNDEQFRGMERELGKRIKVRDMTPHASFRGTLNLSDLMGGSEGEGGEGEGGGQPMLLARELHRKLEWVAEHEEEEEVVEVDEEVEEEGGGIACTEAEGRRGVRAVRAALGGSCGWKSARMAHRCTRAPPLRATKLQQRHALLGSRSAGGMCRHELAPSPRCESRSERGAGDRWA